jgi:5'-nucleotidase
MMRIRPLGARLGVAALAAALGACAGTAPRAPGAPASVAIHLVALNDFHGNLEPSKYTYTPAGGAGPRTILAGGIAVLGGALDTFRSEDPDLLLVAAGDLVGASPALSSMWADEPAVEALNRMGLVASSLGNHEFDQGPAELLRQQGGGCDSPRPAKACRFAPDFKGARYTYLAANVIDRRTGKPLAPGWRVVDVKGIKVGLVGAVLQGTPKVATAAAMRDLDFSDEAAAINAALPAMRAAGAQVFVVLIHEGGHATEPFDQPGCTTLAGPIVDIVKHLDPAIRLVISGHSHTGYLCQVDGRTVTQADSAGHLLSRITLDVDRASGKVTGVDARNVVMDPAVFAPDAALAGFLEDVRARGRTVLERTVARIAGPVSQRQADSGESPLGDLVADAVLAATRADGVVVGIVNPGGIRRDLETGADGAVAFGRAQAVLPFANTLVTMDLTGAQLATLFEQQWARPPDAEQSILQVSQGLTYRWDPAMPPGRRVVPGSLLLHGVPVEPGRTYRIATNNFLAEGGDGFPVFKAGTRRADTGTIDLDAFIAWLHAHPQAGAPMLATPAPRIVRVR